MPEFEEAVVTARGLEPVDSIAGEQLEVVFA